MSRQKIINALLNAVCIILCVLILAVCIVEHRNDGDRLHSREEQSVPLNTIEISNQLPAQEIQDVPLIDLSRLPEGYCSEEQDSGSIRISKGSDIIGWVDTYSIPGGELTTWDPYFRWLGSLGIPDLSDDSLWCMGGSSLHGNWEMHFGSDVPPGQEATVDRYHTFYVGRTKVWDVWFDLMVIDRSEMNMLLDAITIQ